MSTTSFLFRCGREYRICELIVCFGTALTFSAIGANGQSTNSPARNAKRNREPYAFMGSVGFPQPWQPGRTQRPAIAAPNKRTGGDSYRPVSSRPIHSPAFDAGAGLPPAIPRAIKRRTESTYGTETGMQRTDYSYPYRFMNTIGFPQEYKSAAGRTAPQPSKARSRRSSGVNPLGRSN